MFNAITWTLPKIFADCWRHLAEIPRFSTAMDILYIVTISSGHGQFKLANVLICTFLKYCFTSRVVDRFHEIAAGKTRVIGWASSSDHRILRFLHIC